MKKRLISTFFVFCAMVIVMSGVSFADEFSARDLLVQFTEKANRYPDVLDGVNKTYQLNLDEDRYQLKIEDNQAEFADGTPWKADCTFTISKSNFQKLVSGELKAIDAYLSGKLKIKGKLSDAKKLGDIITELKDLP